ncbi:hypothetical protein LWI29_028213 [Acer saccharum]|uniref:Uncharacterized protein n=1 Tax=Acer saccharum TaxID=4024 RepID=A0AA39SV28_ACESA|nr:hypothetical protein LWI29_028213 [Acer saccharum]
MLVTSSSVLVNLPAVTSLIILLRYFSLDFEMQRKAATYNSKPSTANTTSQNKSPESHKVIKRSDWRRKANSPVVEDAIDRLTRQILFLSGLQISGMKICSSLSSGSLPVSCLCSDAASLKFNQSKLRNDQSRATAATAATDLSKDPLLSIDTQSTRSWGSLPLNSQISFERGIQRHHSGGDWCDMLDLISDRKTQALAPENFENMWTKGRNYKRKEGENLVFEQGLQHSVGKSDTANAVENSFQHADQKKSNFSSVTSFQEDDEHNLTCVEEVETGSSSSYTSEEEETGHVLDSPGTKLDPWVLCSIYHKAGKSIKGSCHSDDENESLRSDLNDSNNECTSTDQYMHDNRLPDQQV